MSARLTSLAIREYFYARAPMSIFLVCVAAAAALRGVLCAVERSPRLTLGVTHTLARTYARTRSRAIARAPPGLHTHVYAYCNKLRLRVQRALHVSHVLAYAATAQIRSHSSPFSLLFYRLFDITRIHNAHCLHTRNFPLFHVFSLLLFSSPSCFCFLQFPFFPPFFPLLRIISAALSLRGTRFSLSLSSHRIPLRCVSWTSFLFFFFFTPPKLPPPLFPLVGRHFPALRPDLLVLYILVARPSSVPFVSIPFRRFQPVFPPPRPHVRIARACIREEADPKWEIATCARVLATCALHFLPRAIVSSSRFPYNSRVKIRVKILERLVRIRDFYAS